MKSVLLLSVLLVASVIAQKSVSTCAPPGTGYIGCYMASPAFFPVWPQGIRQDQPISVDSCIQGCRMTGSMYAAMASGSQCTCGSDPNFTWGLTPSDLQCNVACTGNPNQACGGQNNIYSVYDATPGNLVFINDQIYENTMKCTDGMAGDEQCFFAQTVAQCVQTCGMNGLPYAHLAQPGNQCCCSNVDMPVSQSPDLYACATAGLSIGDTNRSGRQIQYDVNMFLNVNGGGQPPTKRSGGNGPNQCKAPGR
eukprot:TRINITY_DN5099_c0_g1_i1.p1 TRINITY_DN5099_c0_g1~~TRINITY_DN5099_c0_g1_i1.p1  ORF type:complete len:252 (-),score=43.95 TRINITY_DN5099_c0_g1_i1:121-876(-)